jgi:DNA-binding XRE family transcriptional regulator
MYSQIVGHLSPMPRPPKKGHPIRDLRAMIGKTQGQFAKMIGLNAHTLKKIEHHERPLTQKVARDIFWKTGVDARLLTKGKLRNTWGREYTPEFYGQWKDGIWPQSDQIAKEKALKLAPWVEILLRAAARKKQLWIYSGD